MRRLVLGMLLLVLSAAPVCAGPFQPSGLPASSPGFVGWANGVASLTRGPQNIANPAGPLASFGVGGNALGAADGTLGVVSLGDGGQITLTFPGTIFNGTGADFAVFENGFVFNGVFGELAFVEVSSNGNDFFRFPSVSLTQTTTQQGPFASLDPTNIHNLAGQFPALNGTPFDLNDLVGISPLLNVNAVTHVRLVDVVGSLDPAHRRLDSLGNPINDLWPTDFPSGGFDLDAVGAIHMVPLPASWVLLVTGLGGLGLRRLRRSAPND